MKEDILKLRSEGKTYNQIKEILGCSKGTISFHCGEGQKEKSKTRTRKLRKNTFVHKLQMFKNSGVKSRVINFQRRTPSYVKDIPTGSLFTIEDVFKKFNGIYRCYLTGDEINIEDSNSYNFDHIIATKSGGKNTLDNLGLLKRDINIMKHSLSVEQFIEYCKKIVIHNGYTITKI